MGCGCKGSTPSHDRPKSFGIDARKRDRQAMCYACEHADRTGLTVLSCEGLPIVHRVNGATCPLSRHPDREGIVTWAGLEWYGVPYPVRLWAWATHPKHPKPSSFTGCGCIRTVKDALTAWMTELRSIFAGNANRTS